MTAATAPASSASRTPGGSTIPPAARTGTLTAARTRSTNVEQRRRTADVPTGLDALGYHRVGSRRLSSFASLTEPH